MFLVLALSLILFIVAFISDSLSLELVALFCALVLSTVRLFNPPVLIDRDLFREILKRTFQGGRYVRDLIFPFKFTVP